MALNPKHVSEIIRNTLIAMNIHEPSIQRLIKGTFAMESGLSDLYDRSNRKRGLMMISDNDTKILHAEYLRFRKPLRKNIVNAIGIDPIEMDLDELLAELDTNIGLMVVMTYAYYASRYDDVPEYDLVSIAKCYDKYYDKYSNPNIVDEFIETYNDFYLD